MSNQSPSNQPAKASLLGLPRELRNMIFDDVCDAEGFAEILVFAVPNTNPRNMDQLLDEPQHISVAVPGKATFFSLWHTSKQIRDEVDELLSCWMPYHQDDLRRSNRASSTRAKPRLDALPHDACYNSLHLRDYSILFSPAEHIDTSST